MNKTIKRVSDSLVTGTCVVLGAIHFASQTTADIVSDVEAKLIRNRDGVDPEHTKKERMYKTIGRQQHILDKVQAFKDAVTQAKERIAREKTIVFDSIESDNNQSSTVILVDATTIMAEN